VDLEKGEIGSVLVAMLELHAVSVSYGSRQAVKSVDLKVKPGEIVAVIGPNGAGKSTLIKAISGVVPLQSGRILFKNNDITRISPVQRARIMAVVPQAQQLGGAFTVEQAVTLGRTAYMNWLGVPSKLDHQKIYQAMQSTKIEDLADRHLAELSGGEQQRVYLARAIAQDTPLLLLDEPTSHLDLEHQVSFLSLVRQFVMQNNLAVLLALHDLNQVALYADRVVLLVGGEVKASGKPREVLTPGLIRSAYNLPVKVIEIAEIGSLIIVPDIKGEKPDDG
jgi:ABC-type cobalamin/Fe3+-siderophores transport system ATPase subunit